MDAFIAVTGNSETNIMSCLVAKSRGIKKTIALVENMDYFQLSQSIGIDTLINKKLLAANNIFRYIRRGEVLALTRLNNLNAEISSLEVAFVFAEKNLQRSRLLYTSKTISKRELEEQETECDRIASLIPLKKRHKNEIIQSLDEISTQLDRIKREEWRSPVNGVVWAVFAHNGEHRDKDTTLLTLVDKSELFVDAYWSEKHLNQLELGRLAEIEVIATGDKFSGIIKSIRAGVGRVRFVNPVQLPAESFKKRVVVARLNIAENAIPFSAKQFYGVGASVRARFKRSDGDSK
jgi:multidrug resistance efflux pump